MREKIKLQKTIEMEESNKNFENKKYENQELISKVEDVARSILHETTSNKYRDHFFPLMITKLDLKVGCEVGVDLGQFSKHILEKTKIEKYYCIDTWQDDFGSNFEPGYFDKNGNIRFNKAQEVLSPYRDRVVMMRMNSVEAAKKIPDNSIDFCYIDGDHSLEMLFDLYVWLPKLKIGGIIGGHDMKDGPGSGISDFWGKQLDYKVKTCTEYYCSRYGHKLNVIGGRILNFWFIKNR